MSIHRCYTEAYPFQSNIFNFLFFGHDKIRLCTLIIAYSAIDILACELCTSHKPQYFYPCKENHFYTVGSWAFMIGHGVVNN